MSYFHYLASNIKLATGCFGEIKTEVKSVERVSRDKLLINGTDDCLLGILADSDRSLEELTKGIVYYNTEEDAASISIRQIDDIDIGIKLHFENKYIYEVSANIGKLIFVDEYSSIDQKCVDSFTNYLKEHLGKQEFIEFVTTWAGEELLDLKPDITIDINNMIDLNNLKIKDRQYIRFTNT